MFESQPVTIEPDRVTLRTADGTTVLENDYVFIFAGGVPPFGLLERSGIGMGGS